MIYLIQYFLIPLLLIFGLYGLTVYVFSLVFQKIGIKEKEVFLSFVILGVITGFLVVWLWIYDSIVIMNPIPVFLGTEVYQLAINYLGDPNSSQAHYTIPWILRIPQIYALISIAFWSLIGLLIQSIYNRRKKRSTN